MRLLVVLSVLVAAIHAQDRVTVSLKEIATGKALPIVTFPRVAIALSPKRPSDLAGVPALSKEARYAIVGLGGRQLALAFDAPPGALALGWIYAGGKQTLGRVKADPQTGAMVVKFTDIDAGGLHIDVRLNYQRTRLLDALVSPARHRRGRAVFAGAVREVILVDADADGKYNGPGDRWVALRTERLRSTGTLRQAEAQRLDEPQIPFQPDGRAFLVEDVAENGSSLTLRLGQPTKTVEAVLSRRYREVRSEYYARFRVERAGFIRKHGLTRPRVKRRAPWQVLTLSAAKERARAAGKPLLAFYVTETNAWCFRYDYYTFPDKEVDSLLRRFVLVRIDAEKDPEQSYAASGARGLPALVPLTADGDHVEFRLRIRNKGAISDLGKKEEMITGWQRPQEFVVNLKRILEAVR